MAGQEQESILNVASLSANLLAEQEVAPRARTFAQFVAELLTQPAVTVYTLGSDGKASYWIPKATVGDAKVHDQAIPRTLDFLAFWQPTKPLFFGPPNNSLVKTTLT